MNGETKPIKGFAVINFPTDLLVTLLSNGEFVTQTIPEYYHNKPSIANMYLNEDNRTEDDIDNLENVRNKFLYTNDVKIYKSYIYFFLIIKHNPVLIVFN